MYVRTVTRRSCDCGGRSESGGIYRVRGRRGTRPSVGGKIVEGSHARHGAAAAADEIEWISKRRARTSDAAAVYIIQNDDDDADANT